MSILSLASCLTGQHKPVRRDVKWNGEQYLGECRHCGASIKRIASGNWRANKG